MDDTQEVIIVIISLLTTFLIIFCCAYSYMEEQKKIDDQTVVLEGAIEDMRIEDGLHKLYIITIDGKEYALNDFKIDETRIYQNYAKVYYQLNIGDYIVIYKSGRWTILDDDT